MTTSNRKISTAMQHELEGGAQTQVSPGHGGVTELQSITSPSFCVYTSIQSAHKFGGVPNPCKHCGYSPVRIDTTFANGNKAFQFQCPNDKCYAQKYNLASVQMPSKREAIAAWNVANPLRGVRG